MAEEKPKNKHRTLAAVWGFTRYIGFGILVFFLIVALFFEAPWRLTSILIILTTVCALMPRAYKKWFWLAIAFIAFALIFWIFLPEKGKWMPYRINLQKELNKLNRQFALPTHQNAATQYRQLIQKEKLIPHQKPPVPTKRYHQTLGAPWKSSQFPELADWIRKQNKTISALNNASKIEKCYYKIRAKHFAPYPQSLPDHTKSHKRWFALLTCAANNDLAENKIDNALQKQIALLKIANHLRQQPFTFDFLIGLNLEAHALNHINKYLITGNPDRYYLDTIENTLQNINHNWKNSWEKIVGFKTLKKKNKLFWVLYEINNDGKIRRARDQHLAGSLGMSLPKNSFWGGKVVKLESILYWFFVPANPQGTENIISHTLTQYSKMTNFYHHTHNYPNLLSNRPVFNISYPLRLTYNRVVKQYYDTFIRAKSLKQATRIIIALRRYKNQNENWPQNLDEIKHLLTEKLLTDPINNFTYGYKLYDENFILYSKGKNNIDENAKGHYYSSRGADDWLIWPRKK